MSYHNSVIGIRMLSNSNYRSYTLEERKEIYSRPIEKQFVSVFEDGKAVVMKHLIKSVLAEDYNRVLDVAKVLALDYQIKVYILPEINARERILRGLFGLSIDNGYTPDIMIDRGVFIDVKSSLIIDKLSHNASKASRQSAFACITNHRLPLNVNQLDDYAKRVFRGEAYDKDEVFFFIDGNIYKKTKDNLGL